MKAILLSLVCSLMLATGQIFWKLSMTGREFSLNYKVIIKVIFSPLFLAGIVLYGLATILWIYLLSKFELSYIYPMIAFAYVFGAFMSVIILKENISLLRLSGILLVVIGVAIIGLSK